MSWINDVRLGLKRLDQGHKSLQKFAFMLFGAFSVIGTLIRFFGRNPGNAWYFFIPAIFLLISARLWPQSLKSLHSIWMGVALAIGWIMSRFLLTLFFFFILTPTGLIMRIAGKDFLSLKLDKSKKSYWIRRIHKPITTYRYKRLF